MAERRILIGNLIRGEERVYEKRDSFFGEYNNQNWELFEKYARWERQREDIKLINIIWHWYIRIVIGI